MSVSLPSSYETLPWSDIRVSHHPANSPSPTPIVIVTLHRPGKHNAFTGVMTEELERLFTLVDVDDRVRAVV